MRRHLRAVPDVPLDVDAAVRSLTPRLQRYAGRRLGDRHEAEELACVALAGAGAGAGGADCAQAPAQSELSVDAPVDLTPVGVELPTVATDRVPCHRVPDTALTQCTDPGEDR